MSIIFSWILLYYYIVYILHTSLIPCLLLSNLCWSAIRDPSPCKDLQFVYVVWLHSCGATATNCRRVLFPHRVISLYFHLDVPRFHEQFVSLLKRKFNFRLLLYCSHMATSNNWAVPTIFSLHQTQKEEYMASSGSSAWHLSLAVQPLLTTQNDAFQL